MGAEQSNLVGEDVKQDNVGFFINGKEYMVRKDHDRVGPQSVLVDYIRDHAGFKGTKYMCREGGCGACVVSVKSRDPRTGQDVIRAVNSCLVPVFSADGWDITTVEALGNRRDGYHNIQKQIANFSGTQCGFCTPGMVMNMFSLSQANPGFKGQDVEDSFDGNICRCTGYRPILDAFKSMSVDASEELKRKTVALNPSSPELKGMKCGSEGSSCCQTLRKSIIEPNELEEYDSCCSNAKIYLRFRSGEEWVKATSLNNLFEAVQQYTATGIKYRVVAGNTGTGVYKNDGPYQAYIDTNGVPELKVATIVASGVELGGGVTLTNSIEFLQKAAELDGYFYTAQMSKHLKRVANTPVRNVATLAGNLMLKHAHREFPSDVFLLLETVGAKLKIGTSATVVREYSMMEFKDTDMNGKIIISVKLPALRGRNYYFKTYKITRRYQNAHAYVNAGFLMKVDPKRKYSVRDKPTIVFGGINPEFVHAFGTEVFLVGKFLDVKTVRNAMEYLEKEIQPMVHPPDASTSYRKGLTQALFYKFLLGILKESVKPDVISGGQDIERGNIYGTQNFDSDESKWPLYQPIPKLEAMPQASGEAEYINDMNPEFGELFGAFVVTTVANAKLKNVDPSEALMIPGVVSFISAKDVPGLNNFSIFYPEPEEIFVSSKVHHAGQSVGLILAETREAAFLATKQVSITYEDVKKPILDIKTSLSRAKEQGTLKQCILEVRKSVSEPQAAPHMIKGEFQTGSQYHFHMEPQTCVCVPREDGMDVFSSTQFPNSVQTIVATSIGVPKNSINVSVRRLGGAYGAKISKATQIAAACAVASHVSRKPVRVVLDLDSNMKMIGKRLPYWAKYEVGFDDDGKIMNLKIELFCDPGCVSNEETSLFAMLSIQSCYQANGWEVTPAKAVTNTHSNTYCRAPGSTQAIAIIETIMEQIANSLRKDPVEVRMNNFIKAEDPIFGIPNHKLHGENPLPKMIEDTKSSSDYDDRRKFIENFNKNNRWMKRGMSLVPLRYPIHYPEYVLRYPVYIAVYAPDGTVAVSHAGIEMGQGINTKCAQVVAHTLGIPLKKVMVKPTNTLISPNCGLTGAAITSELVCHAAVECCKQLLDKMEPVKKEMDNPTWEQLVGMCYGKHILLTAHHQDKPDDVTPYDVWGLTITEVEVDILTGEHKIVRVDLVEDAGQSLSPEVDIGQIEGAFVMGLGMWLSEKIVFDENTGELLTHNTWEYKPPLPRDIPEDFRVTMLRNRSSNFGVLGSKATGEPPLTMSVGVIFALRNAITSAREDVGNFDWYQMDGPVTPEDIHRLALTSKAQFDF